MSDDQTDGFPGVQVSAFINGDQYVFRAENGATLAELTASVETHGDEILTNLGNIKQIVIAKGVFTGDSQNAGSKNAGGSGGNSSAGRDTPPPSSGGLGEYQKGGKSYVTYQPCKHGDRLDLRGGNAKSDFYCTLKTDPNDSNAWKLKCPPVKAP